MGERQARWALIVVLAQVGCSRGADPSNHAPSNAPETEAAQALAPPAAPVQTFAADVAPAGEARRTTVTRVEGDALLRPYLVALRDHFGVTTQGPFQVQRAELAGGRTAVLVSRADESDPIELTIDRDQLLWSKPRPLAGILPPVKHVTVAPRPDGGVVVFGWVASLRMVAARMWADDGNPFGDFEIFAPGSCDALSAAYAPTIGWIVVCTSPDGTRAQRMREDGTIAWGQDGAKVGASSASGPATIVFDSAQAFLLLERVAAVGGDRLLVFRDDANAQPLWPAPLDLGADFAARGVGGATRVEANVIREGVVRVERPRGVAGSGGVRAAEIRSGGEVRFLAQ
jgi:hypothetical protein